jgi:predicted nucleic acid-binding protein
VSEYLVVNASPLISLARIGQIELLEKLASAVAVPQAVVSEVLAGPPGDAARLAIESGWGERVRAEAIPPPVTEWSLGAGESEVIAVALSRIGSRAILDDARGRSCAKTLRVPVVGTLGVILKSKKAGLIPSAAKLLQALREGGSYLDDTIVSAALSVVGESWNPKTHSD